MSNDTTSQAVQPEENNYIVTARKWRPQRFMDVVGQEHVSRTLRNAVLTARTHHAYMFNGPRGVGKTTSARILAKSVNCLNRSEEGEPCGVCQSCTEISSGRSMDVIEIDGASNNSVDDIRTLRENAKYPPTLGKYKLYIIDEVHMLSTSAFNALLKILEEPPKHLIFVFATTEPHKVPATILSRCQRFDFRRMQVEEIAAHLRHIATAEGISTDEESLLVIAKKGDGSMRDSQSIFDQAVAFCGANLTYERVNDALNLIDTEFFFTISKAIRERNVSAMLTMARDVFMRGYDMQECLLGLAEHFRNILTVLATQDTSLIELSRTQKEQYQKEASHFSQGDVLQLLNHVISAERDLRFAPNPRLRFEFALVKMASMSTAVEIGHLLRELAELKKKIDDGSLQGLALMSAPQDYASHGQAVSPSTASLGASQKDSPEKDSPEKKYAGQSSAPKTDAHTLQKVWRQFLGSLSDVSAKTFLQRDDIGRWEFSDGEARFYAKEKNVAIDLVVEKKSTLMKEASAFFRADIRIIFPGAEKEAGSAFADYISPNFSTSSHTEELRGIVVTLGGERVETSRNGNNDEQSAEKKGVANGSMAHKTSLGDTFYAENYAHTPHDAHDTLPMKSGGGNEDEHPIDNALKELFGVVEIPKR